MISVKRFEMQALRVVLGLFFLLGCARVNLTSKDPIKVDVTMRLDIYQHVANDANAIEDMISAPKDKNAVLGKTSWLSLGVPDAYAQEGDSFPANVGAAIDARKQRRSDLTALESRGVIGENYAGFVELKDAADNSASSLVNDENNDRRAIYEHVAQKNGTDTSETGKIFAKRIQADAPAGTPIQDASGNWTMK